MMLEEVMKSVCDNGIGYLSYSENEKTPPLWRGEKIMTSSTSVIVFDDV